MNLLTRILRALAALMLILAVVVGGAWALARFGRLSALTTFDWRQVWVVADDGSLVLGLITVVGWIAWTLATLSVVSELIAALSQQRYRLHLPGLGVFAPASAVLITAIIGLVAGQSASPAPAHASPDQPAPVVPIAAPLNASAETSDTQKLSAPEERTHLVQPGDDLWSLAEHYYSDGSLWRTIAGANQTVLLEGTDMLQPGMLLFIPEVSADGADGGVLVGQGDTLSGLAEEHLGDAERWQELAKANPEVVVDPDVIQPGITLQLPQPESPTDASAEPTAAQQDTSHPVSRATPDQATRRSPAPAPAAEQQASIAAAGWVAQLPAAFGAVLTTTLLGAYAGRRLLQQAGRPLGRRLPPLSGDAGRLRAALAAAAETMPAPAPATVPQQQHVAAADVRISVGTRGELPVNLEVVSGDLVWVCGEHGDDVAFATAIALSVACAEDIPETRVVAAGQQFGWLRSLDEPGLEVLNEVSDGLRLVSEIAADRAASMPAGATLAQLRAEGDLADAWCPVLVLLAGAPDALAVPELPTELGLLGISVLACAGVEPAPRSASRPVVVTDQRAWLRPDDEPFTPHLVSAPAQRVLVEVFNTANLTEYPTASWWDHTPDAELPVLRVPAWPGSVEEPPVDSTIESQHPVINLLGPVKLVGATGEPPKRAIKQLQEYCAWLLEHPGATAAQMADSLMVAETTRRSNMSRLRVWLGKDPEGGLYLPDAYSGRITLHPDVTSDWEQLQLCISGGVNRVSNATLTHALGLVRGAPLADAAPGQWYWAEQLRADMSAAVRDIGVVLAGRAIELGDYELARWAVDKAWLAAPEDDLLVGMQLRLAHAAGDQAEVDRLVLGLARRSRNLGVDLAPELVTLLQEVVEGRARPRQSNAG
ncbi:MAG: LysM peptidoglycan-binding domain-containing protein [Brooklawnia sp.]|jgi:flagellar biogenesis protein FliO